MMGKVLRGLACLCLVMCSLEVKAQDIQGQPQIAPVRQADSGIDFHLADLSVPSGTANLAVVITSQGVPMSGQETTRFVDWLNSDPVIQGRLATYSSNFASAAVPSVDLVSMYSLTPQPAARQSSTVTSYSSTSSYGESYAGARRSQRRAKRSTGRQTRMATRAACASGNCSL
jgi:hypothetical protein